MAHSTATGDKNSQFIGEERASHRNPSLCRYRYGIDNRRELAHRSDPAQIFAAVTEQPAGNHRPRRTSRWKTPRDCASLPPGTAAGTRWKAPVRRMAGWVRLPAARAHRFDNRTGLAPRLPSSYLVTERTNNPGAER